jgi:hypothetical protein
LENYLLVPSASRTSDPIRTVREVCRRKKRSEKSWTRILLDFREAVFDATVNEALALDRAAGVQQAIRVARARR